MKVHGMSVSPEALIGAPISLGDVELGVISGIEFDLQNHKVMILFTSDWNGTTGYEWSQLKDAEISLQHPQWNRNTLNQT